MTELNDLNFGWSHLMFDCRELKCSEHFARIALERLN